MKMIPIVQCLVAVGLIGSVALVPPMTEQDTISVSGGLIAGVLNKDGDVRSFKGIPFAAPPVGDLRWKAPQPVKPWSGIRRCDQFGPSPMQPAPVPFGPWSAEFLIPKAPISEDCLYLNVWTGRGLAASTSAAEKRPRERRGGKPLPVLVWIYGGGFGSGGSGAPIYDGEATANLRRGGNRQKRDCLCQCQLPGWPIWVFGSSGVEQRIRSAHIRQLWIDGSDCGPAVGPAKHSGFRW